MAQPCTQQGPVNYTLPLKVWPLVTTFLEGFPATSKSGVRICSHAQVYPGSRVTLVKLLGLLGLCLLICKMLATTNVLPGQGHCEN